jgi:hypothetical protein
LLDGERRPGAAVPSRPAILPSSLAFLAALDLLPPDYYFG